MKNLIYILFFLLLFSCKKDSVIPPSDLGFGYYPGKVGSWIIYDVDSIIYDGLNNDTIYYAYQIKELIESEFTDNQGRKALRIERYRRDDTASAWGIPRIWTAVKTNQLVERTEENTKYIKLTFPVRKDIFWDGNALNTDEKRNYEYLSVDESALFNNNTMSFDSVVTVEQLKNINCVERKYFIEKYAKNVGLVFQEATNIDIQTEDCVIFKSVDGLEFRMEIYAYGLN